MAVDLQKLNGIGPEALKRIKDEGITTIEDFYETAKHPDTRKELSRKIDVDEFTLEGWSANAGNYLFMMNCEW